MDENIKEELKHHLKHFENHVASYKDYGLIKIVDFKNPNTNHYRIRFLFEEDYCRLHISGDLGHLIATNYNNMCFDGFKDFIHNTGYFETKVDCHDRAFHYYDQEQAKEDLMNHFEDYDFTLDHPYSDMTPEECRDYTFDELLEDFSDVDGFGSLAYSKLSDMDPDCFEYISSLGRKETLILGLYMMAFDLAIKQLEERKEI